MLQSITSAANDSFNISYVGGGGGWTQGGSASPTFPRLVPLPRGLLTKHAANLAKSYTCKCCKQRCAGGLFSRDNKTEARLRPWSPRTRPRPRPRCSVEAEERARNLKFQPRRDRAKVLLHLEMASRPRRQDRGHIPGCKYRNGAVVGGLKLLQCKFVQ